MLKINSNHAQLSKFEGLIIDKKECEEGKSNKEDKSQEDINVIERCVEHRSIDAYRNSRR